MGVGPDAVRERVGVRVAMGTITTKDGAVMVDNAKVIQADIVVDNGVIHVIDAVIMPKM
mgnify:CR=1 FL=1